MTRLIRALPAVTLVAVLVVTASSEFMLATTVLALPWWVAWGVPAAIDSYVVAAVHTGRDVAAAMTVMALSLFAAAGSHALAGPDGHLPPEISGPAGAGILAALVIVAWRVHVLIPVATPKEEPRTSPAPTATTPVPSTPPSAASAPPQRQEAAPASAPAPAPAGTSGRSGGGRRVEPSEDLVAAFRDVAKDLRHQKLTVNYKNVAPRLRDRGHPAGRAKVDALIAEHAQPQLQAV